MSVGADNPSWVRPLGSAVDGDFDVAVTPTATSPVATKVDATAIPNQRFYRVVMLEP